MADNQEKNLNDTYEKIVFESDEGREEFFILEQTMLGGINYIAVTDDLDSDDGEFLILKEIPSEEDDLVSYEIVEDENELSSVIKIFDELIEDFDLDLEV